MSAIIVWFRRDLRLADNVALARALASGGTVIPAYIDTPDEPAGWSAGAASNWWLHSSLTALAQSLEQRGSRLVIRRAATALAGLRRLISESGARAVYWNRLYEPAEAARDVAVAAALTAAGVEAATFSGHLLLEPGSLRTGSGGPYRVYTPFARAARQRLTLPAACPPPSTLPAVPTPIRSEPLESLQLRPQVAWDTGLAKAWQPGEGGAHRLLRTLPDKLAGYESRRDLPSVEGTSRLSPHLHFGEVTPAQLWRAVTQAVAGGRASGLIRGGEALERELLWREFAQHVLHHFPHTSDAPLDARFRPFPWRRSTSLLTAWQRGRTGIPIVDAGMRELWATGFMHNRVRMITASLLTKHLRIDWLDGARWFWDTLVDADLASNTLNWQWVAGCGADAAPYFRIFNPVLQSRKFDLQGKYLLRWLPELARLPARHRHAPWEAPQSVLAAAGIALGRDYPRPIVDLAAARVEALTAFRGLPARTAA
jgi:deoxyribodipyrimidine photo-lyase